jgi:uncharacterized protein YkwD
VLLAVVLAAPLLLPRPQSAHATPGLTATSLLTALNAVRAAHGLRPLTLSRQLDAAASAHSGEMLADGYFDHNSFDGDAYWKRIAGFYPEPRTGTWAVGENLLWSPAAIDAQQVVALWMASPGHRVNVLSPLWRQVGIGFTSSGDGPGVFGGRSVVVVTTDFGVRKS